MLVNFSYYQAIHFKHEKWEKGEYVNKKWFSSTLWDYLLTIATPNHKEVLDKIIWFIESADASFIVSIKGMPYILQIADEPVGRSYNHKLLKSLVLYWMPIYENGRIIFKCMHSKCDYAWYLYLSEEHE